MTNKTRNTNTGMSSVWKRSSIMLKCGINGIKNTIFNGEKLFINNIPDSNKFSFLKDDSVCFYNCEDSITKDINKTNYNFYADKARLVQTETQEQSLNLIKKYVKSTGIMRSSSANHRHIKRDTSMILMPSSSVPSTERTCLTKK